MTEEEVPAPDQRYDQGQLSYVAFYGGVVMVEFDHTASLVISEVWAWANWTAWRLKTSIYTFTPSIKVDEVRLIVTFTTQHNQDSYTQSEMERIRGLIAPKYLRLGTVEMNIDRHQRVHVGTTLTVRVMGTPTPHGLDENELKTAIRGAKLVAVREGGRTIAVAMQHPTLDDEVITRFARRVGDTLSVRLQMGPLKADDDDLNARLHREYDYVVPTEPKE